LKKLIVLALALSLILSGCSNLGALAGLAAAGYGIYQATKSN